MNVMIPLLAVSASTFIIYTFVVLGFRLVGRRQLSQLTAADVVVILIMGSAVETAMVRGNTSLMVGLVSAATLLISNYGFNRLASNRRRLNHAFGGGIKILVHNGTPVIENLRRVGLTMTDLMAAVRERGYDSLDDIQYATSEEDGEITVVSKSSQLVRIPANKNPVRRISETQQNIESR